MPKKERLSVADLMRDNIWRQRTLKELYDAVASDYRKELIMATGYSYPTAIGLLEHPYERSLADLVRFSNELGVSFEEVVLPMAFNAMQRTPTIHERMVVNPAPAVDEYEYEDPKTGAMQVARVPRLHVGDTVRVKGAQRASVVEVDTIEGNALVEFIDGLTVWYPINELEFVEEEEEEEEEGGGEAVSNMRRFNLIIKIKRILMVLDDLDRANDELQACLFYINDLLIVDKALYKTCERNCYTIGQSLKKIRDQIAKAGLIEGDVETPNPTYSR